MPTIEVPMQRFSITSAKSFDAVVESLAATLGHPDMSEFRSAVTASKSLADLEKLVHASIGPSGLMEFVRFDLGEILRKEGGGQGPRILRLIVGNPLVMKEMAKSVPDAASYAPVTILVDERSGGVHLSYDRMASLLAPYGSQEALRVAGELDAKIEGLLRDAA